jgi:hypothetical protein
LQSPGHMGLTYDFGKALRAPFACKYQVGHGSIAVQ